MLDCRESNSISNFYIVYRNRMNLNMYVKFTIKLKTWICKYI